MQEGVLLRIKNPKKKTGVELHSTPTGYAERSNNQILNPYIKIQEPQSFKIVALYFIYCLLIALPAPP